MFLFFLCFMWFVDGGFGEYDCGFDFCFDRNEKESELVVVCLVLWVCCMCLLIFCFFNSILLLLVIIWFVILEREFGFGCVRIDNRVLEFWFYECFFFCFVDLLYVGICFFKFEFFVWCSCVDFRCNLFKIFEEIVV